MRSLTAGQIDRAVIVTTIVLTLTAMSACAMQASTLPKVTVGNTGCTQESLAVFGYDDDARSWMAVCGEQFFSCSDTGRRTARCSAAADVALTPEVKRRAPLLLTLPRERRSAFIAADITRGTFEGFVERMAMISSMSQRTFEKIDDAFQVFVEIDDATRAAIATCGEALVKLKVDTKTGRIRGAKPPVHDRRGRCMYDATKELLVPQEYRDRSGHVFVYLGPVDEAARAAIHASSLARSETEASEPAPEIAQSASLIGTSDVEAPSGDTASSLEDQIRQRLDESRDDILACAGAERVVLRVEYAAESPSSLGLNGPAAGGPEEGCIRAVIGVLPSSGETAAGTVIHVVR